MAVDPHTAKIIAQVVISQIKDEEKRQRLVIGIVILVVVNLFVILIPVFAMTSGIATIKSFFKFGDDGKTADSSYYELEKIHNDYANSSTPTTSKTLDFKGTLPLPVSNAVVTCEFGARIHPITGKRSFHTGMDIAGAWHTPVMAVYKGKIYFAGVQRGYGNCVEIEHKTETGNTFYTFYAHLGRIDVQTGQEVEQGTQIGIQGGDPHRDVNYGSSTGTHCHFEIRTSPNGNFVNPRDYLFGNKEV